MTYRMKEDAYDMDDEFFRCLAAAGVTLIDRSSAPYDVVFEGTEDALRELYRENFSEDGQPFIVPADQLPCAAIETVHRVRVDFEPESWSELDAIENEIFALASKFGAQDAQVFGGNPACGPYFTCEMADLEAAHVLGRRLVDFLLKTDCKVTS